ncbi:MAG: amidase [Nocardioides sp.]|uniref:amidase n=1 Tax=Nocardioides sp. TaxID=35761 RepID=UPI0039E5F586
MRTIEQSGRDLREGRTTSVELVNESIARADRLDPIVGAFTQRFDDEARAAAHALDAELARGVDRGPLHGVPIGVKDIIATREAGSTAQSRVPVPEWDAGRDALVVHRLRAVGAVVLGKMSTMEFAGGVLAPDNPFPTPRNPWDHSRWPGGSSSGSGSGVAAGMVLGALGTDTGGSVRSPAAMCGVTGFKPSAEAVPRDGVMPTAWSYDTVGPVARSAWDCAALFEAMADRRVLDALGDSHPSQVQIAGLRVGVERTLVASFPSADLLLACSLDAAVAELAALGADVREIEVPHLRDLAQVTMLQSAAQAYAWHRDSLREHWGLYGLSLKRNLITGLMLSAGDMVQLDRARAVARRDVAALFADLDVMVMPTAPWGAPELSQVGHLDELADAVAFTAVWNAVGYPAISVPIGLGGGGLPLGMQVIAPPSHDARVLAVAHAYQRRTDWHLAVPRGSVSARGMAAPAALAGTGPWHEGCSGEGSG